MNALCKQQGTSFFLFVIPDLLDIPHSIERFEDYPFGDDHQLIHERLEKMGVPHIDVLPNFNGKNPNQLAVHPFDRHFNAEGIDIIAQALYESLRSRIADFATSTQ